MNNEEATSPTKSSKIIYILVAMLVVSAIIGIAAIISQNFRPNQQTQSDLVNQEVVNAEPTDLVYSDLSAAVTDLDQELATLIEEEGSNEDIVPTGL